MHRADNSRRRGRGGDVTKKKKRKRSKLRVVSMAAAAAAAPAISFYLIWIYFYERLSCAGSDGPAGSPGEARRNRFISTSSDGTSVVRL